MSSLAKAFSTGLKTQFNKPSIALAMSTFYQWKNCYNVWQPVSDPVCRCQVWSINSCPAACTHSAGPVRKCRAPRVMLKKRESLQGVWLEKCEDIIIYIIYITYIYILYICNIYYIYIVVQQKCQRESFCKSGSKATAIRKSDGMTVCEDWAHIPLALLVILWHREKTCLWVVGSNESKESFRSFLPEFRQNHGRRNLYVPLSYDISMRWVL